MAHRMNVKQTKNESKETEIVDQMNSRIQKGVFNCFGQSFNREMFCDSIVDVEGVKFHCHRFVLNACSGYFAAMLRSDKRGRQVLNATLQGISSSIFKLILDAMYTGSIAITRDNMIEMWNAANLLRIEFLVSECEDYVSRNINSQNYDAVFCYAHQLKSVKVIGHALKYRSEQFFYFSNSRNLHTLHYKELLQILQSKTLPACADFRVEAALKWCGAKRDDKTQDQGDTGNSQNLVHLADLLQAADLSKVSAPCLSSLLKNPFIQRDGQAVALVNAQAASGLCNPRKLMLPVGLTFRKYSVNYQDTVDRTFIGDSSCLHCQPWLLDQKKN